MNLKPSQRGRASRTLAAMRVVSDGGRVKTVACPPARVRSPAQEACGAEDLTGHGPFGSVSGHVSLLVR